jgi:hypothetical protein
MHFSFSMYQKSTNMRKIGYWYKNTRPTNVEIRQHPGRNNFVAKIKISGSCVRNCTVHQRKEIAFVIRRPILIVIIDVPLLRSYKYTIIRAHMKLTDIYEIWQALINLTSSETWQESINLPSRNAGSQQVTQYNKNSKLLTFELYHTKELEKRHLHQDGRVSGSGPPYNGCGSFNYDSMLHGTTSEDFSSFLML